MADKREVDADIEHVFRQPAGPRTEGRIRAARMAINRTLVGVSPDGVGDDHDWVESVEDDGRLGPAGLATCRKCGFRLWLDDRTQRIPDWSCSRQLVKDVMKE